MKDNPGSTLLLSKPPSARRRAWRPVKIDNSSTASGNVYTNGEDPVTKSLVAKTRAKGLWFAQTLRDKEITPRSLRSAIEESTSEKGEEPVGSLWDHGHSCNP